MSDADSATVVVHPLVVAAQAKLSRAVAAGRELHDAAEALSALAEQADREGVVGVDLLPWRLKIRHLLSSWLEVVDERRARVAQG